MRFTECSQTPEATHCMNPLLCPLEKAQLQKQRPDLWLSGWGTDSSGGGSPGEFWGVKEDGLWRVQSVKAHRTGLHKTGLHVNFMVCKKNPPNLVL